MGALHRELRLLGGGRLKRNASPHPVVVAEDLLGCFSCKNHLDYLDYSSLLV